VRLDDAIAVDAVERLAHVDFKFFIFGRMVDFLAAEKLAVAVLVDGRQHYHALGQGLELALSCDIRLASEDAQFGLPEVGLGIIPAAGGSQTLPRMIGRTNALEILLTGRWIKAEEAYHLKLVNQVVSRGDLLPAAERLANKIKGYSPTAVACAKQAITRGLDLSLDQGLELEAKLGRLIILK